MAGRYKVTTILILDWRSRPQLVPRGLNQEKETEIERTAKPYPFVPYDSCKLYVAGLKTKTFESHGGRVGRYGPGVKFSRWQINTVVNNLKEKLRYDQATCSNFISI